MQQQQLFLILDNSSQFYSRESDCSPQLVIGLKKKTECPTVSPVLSVSTKPSLRLFVSFVSSLSVLSQAQGLARLPHQNQTCVSKPNKTG
jgi:hypothetical protein